MTGPNRVECSPIRNTQASSTGTWLAQKPQAASSMIAISSDLTSWITRVLSYLSVSWPLVAENSRKGRMNTAPITSPAMFGFIHSTSIW